MKFDKSLAIDTCLIDKENKDEFFLGDFVQILNDSNKKTKVCKHFNHGLNEPLTKDKGIIIGFETSRKDSEFYRKSNEKMTVYVQRFYESDIYKDFLKNKINEEKQNAV